jgi:hypothetical protein
MKTLSIVAFASIILLSCHTTKPAVEEPIDISTVVYKGGDGKSSESAVLILNAKNEKNGIAAEYAWISKFHGERNAGWKYGEQSSVMHEGKRIDVIMIYLVPSNAIVNYYFDVSDFYGK